ncbi:Protein MAIN-LIKE 1 [Glycine soja]
MDYAYHVASKLKLASHGRKVEKFGKPAPHIEGIVAVTTLSSLITCSLERGDKGLLYAFVERWHKETSSFYLPIGKMTITLNGVASLLHLPITSAFHTFDAIDVEQLLEVSRQDAKDETGQCRGAYVRLAWLRDIYRSKCDTRQWTLVARAYLLHLIGCALFAKKSVIHISVVFLDAFCDLNQSRGFSWGAVALVHMYDNLNVAFKHTTKHLTGYITLLQCWIYEHFPTIANIIIDEDYLTTYHKRLDRVMPDVVCWIPYGDPHAFKEFELISLFSGHII